MRGFALFILILVSQLFGNSTWAAADTMICSGSGREKLWAQTRLDADLMQKYIESRHLRLDRVSTRVYVLDTGFDSLHTAELARPGSLRLEAGVYGAKVTNQDGKEDDLPGDPAQEGGTSLVGDPDNDVGGHGTMVVSAIAAGNGLGVAPHADVTVYRITSADSETTPNKFVDYAIMRACLKGAAENPRGLTLINQSWDDRDDESGNNRFESRRPDIVRLLLDKGCLLVKAAGNDSYRGAPLPGVANGESPVLRVAATQPFDYFASFSSTGVVAAPGEGVYVLESHAVKSPAYPMDRCEPEDYPGKGSPRRFVSGTSFAAPFTAGIASEIVGVLRSMNPEKFESLSSSERITLVVRILKASEEFGNVNGLRAVLIAERWSAGTPEVLDLVKLLSVSPPKVCATDPGSREAFTACPSLRTPELAQKLAMSAIDSRRFASAAGDLRAAVDLSDTERNAPFIERWVSAYLSHATPAQLINSLDASIAQYLLPAHIETAKAQAAPLLSALLTSYSALDYLERGPGRGSEDILTALIDDLALLRHFVSDADFVRLIDQAADYRLSKLDPAFLATDNANSFSACMRILNGLAKRPEFADLSGPLRPVEEKVLVALDGHPALFGKEQNLFVISEEIYANRVYAFEFLARHEDELRPMLSDTDPDHYGLIKVQYWAEHASQETLPLLIRISRESGGNPKWKFNSIELGHEVAAGLARALQTSSDQELSDYLRGTNWSSAAEMDVLDAALQADLKPILDTLKSGAKTVPAGDREKIQRATLILSQPQAKNALPKLGEARFLLQSLNVYSLIHHGVLPESLTSLLAGW